jgi:hypothetical protein
MASRSLILILRRMSDASSGRPDLVHELVVLVRSRHSLIALEAADRERACVTLASAAAELGVPFFIWTRTKGIRRNGVEAGIYGTSDPAAALAHVEAAAIPAIYLFEDLTPSLAELIPAQRLRDAVASLSSVNGALVLLDGADALPPALRALAASVKLPPPASAEYHALIARVLRDLSPRMKVRAQLDQAGLQQLLTALRGLSLHDAEKIVTRVIVEDGVLDSHDIAKVLGAKHATLKAAGLLEFCPVDVRLEDVADLAALKAWLAQRRAVIAAPERAASMGLPFPRGMLLVGVPGCGKSMCAKAVAADWGLPLLKLDTSGIYDKYIGESEKRFLSAIRSAEQAGPAVLWIDEIEKAFSAGGDGDGGVSSRILGTFLSWLQERKGDVFVVATANDIARLPAELVRKGRFDEIFFVDLPDTEVRAAIFQLNLDRRKLPTDQFDTPALASVTEGFSGAEIEQVVVSALYGAFATGAPLRMADLSAEIARTRPLSATMHERIAGLRAWARERTVAAH